MIESSGKPDVLELARAQLDFGALNSAAPSAKEILFKAQTIVPIAPRVPWERFAKVAAMLGLGCVLACAPWVPQQSVLGMAGMQFDRLLPPAEAQALINRAVSGLSQPGHETLVSADYAPQDERGGLLLLRAAAFGKPSSAVQTLLGEALSGADPPAAPYPLSEARRSYRTSLARLAWQRLRAGRRPLTDNPPATQLASSVLSSVPLLRQELAADLLNQGFQLSGFGFASNSALLPPGCQFTVDAWPEPAAVGVSGYDKLTTYQRADLRDHVAQWLERVNLRNQALQLSEEPTDWEPVVCTVLDREGHADPLLSARLNAVLPQPSASDLSDREYSLDQVVAAAAAAALPGIQRRVDFERVSDQAGASRYKVRVTMLGHAASASAAGADRPDPVEDSAVKDEW